MVLKSGFFPDAWKKASILPLLKTPSLDPSGVKNYRSKLVLPLPAKILEKAGIFKENTDFLDPAQHGIRPYYCTESTLSAVTEEIRSIVDRGD